MHLPYSPWWCRCILWWLLSISLSSITICICTIMGCRGGASLSTRLIPVVEVGPKGDEKPVLVLLLLLSLAWLFFIFRVLWLFFLEVLVVDMLLLCANSSFAVVLFLLSRCDAIISLRQCPTCQQQWPRNRDVEWVLMLNENSNSSIAEVCHLLSHVLPHRSWKSIDLFGDIVWWTPRRGYSCEWYWRYPPQQVFCPPCNGHLDSETNSSQLTAGIFDWLYDCSSFFLFHWWHRIWWVCNRPASECLRSPQTERERFGVLLLLRHAPHL